MHHIEGQILGQSVHLDTLYFAWAIMAVILLFATVLAQSVSAETSKYNSLQFVAEGFYNFINGMAKGQMGKHAKHYVFFLGSLFIFILTSYYAGLLPWKMGAMFDWWPMMGHGEHAEAWHGASPCADINVPAGMALCVIVLYFFSGVPIAGFDYLQMYLPINFTKKGVSLNLLCLIEILDLFVRPLTLTLRLFANTFAGETLMKTFISLVALVVPAAVLGFELFVGAVQSFIFTILASVYIGLAVKHAEHAKHH